MAHATTSGSGGPCDEASDGLFAVLLDPARCFDLGVAADFTDHDDGFGFRVFVEELDDVEVGGAVDGVTTDADAGRLAVALAGQLPDSFVGEGAGAGDDADLAALVDVARGDADTAAAVRLVAAARGHEARAIRTDEARALAQHGALGADHVTDRDAFGDGHREVEVGLDAFEDRVRREGRGDEDGGHRGARLLGGFGHRVENRHLDAVVLERLAALAGGDAGDDLGAVVDGEASVAGTKITGDALDQDTGLFVDENGHVKGRAGVTCC